MKYLSSFLPFILPSASGCSEPIAKQALIAAAIEFCERTSVVQRTLDPVDVNASDREIELPVPRHQAVTTVLKAWFKGRELALPAQTDIHLPTAYRDNIPDVDGQSGDPVELYHIRAGVVGLNPVPTTDEENVLTVRAAMRPTRSATQLEDVLFEDWVEVLASGALARLHAMPGQPFTDQVQALNRRGEFQLGIGKAYIESSKGKVRTDLRVTPRPFA